MKTYDQPDDSLPRARRMERLGLLDTPAEEVFDGFTRLAARLTDSPVAVLTLVDAGRVWAKSAVGLPQGVAQPMEGAFCAHAIRSAAFFEVEDARTDERFSSHPLVTTPPGLVHYAGVPLVLPDGLAVGTLCVMRPAPGRLEPAQRELLAELGANVANILALRIRERELQHEQLLLNAGSLSELVPLGMFSLDARGELMQGNAQWARMLGAPDAASLLASGWQQAVHPDDVDLMAQGWAAAVAARHRFAGTLRTRPDAAGAFRWLKFRINPVAQGPLPIAFVGTVIDVTETVVLEQELQQKNRLLYSIIENLPCGLMVFDRHLRHVVGNEAGWHMLDLPEQNFKGRRATFENLVRYLAQEGEFGSGSVEEIVSDRLADVLARKPYRRERVRADGTLVGVQGSYMPDGGLIITTTDVTSERRASRELRTSESRLARALSASGLGLWEYDLEREEVFLSRGLAHLVGLPERDSLVDAREPLALFPPHELAAVAQARRQLLKGDVDRVSMEHQMTTAAGEVIWALSEAQVAERSPEGRALKVVGTSKDITARKRADAELRAALAQADQANRAKSNFLATMTHEIRTPLNGVIGLTQLLAGASLPPMEADSVALIDSCAKSLLSLVDNILDFSKIEAGRLTLDEVPVDLRKLLQEIGDVFSVRAAEKGLRFELRLAPEVPHWVAADPGRLRQILLNLLGNALKFTTQGGFSLEVDAGCEPDALRFAVVDSGIGISEADQSKLFTRFTQVDASATRKYQGTGLGLAISRQLAQLMGGDVHLQSRPGQGSRFTVAVPLRRAEPAVSAAGAQTRRVASGARVLLAEDNEVNQLVAQRMLASLGYANVQIAGDGQQALEACRAAPFDLVLMDCQMPVMDGLQATRAIRALGLRIPILALTASATSEDRDLCLAAGMDDYLTKPIELPVLADKLDRWLAHARAAGRVPPAPVSVADASPVFDDTVLENCFMGDIELFAASRGIFERQTRSGLEEIGQALTANDLARVRFLGHRLLGSAATIGATRLARCCARLEKAADAGDETRAQLAHARTAFRAFLEESAEAASTGFAPV